MFKLSLDERLSAWASLRRSIDESENPFQDVINFWSETPLIPVNPSVDAYYPASWPTPWEIIEKNRYDDFTKALMIGYTLLLTDKFKDSSIEIRTLVDQGRKKLYNVIFLDNEWVFNYKDIEVVQTEQIPATTRVENLVPLKRPR